MKTVWYIFYDTGDILKVRQEFEGDNILQAFDHAKYVAAKWGWRIVQVGITPRTRDSAYTEYRP